MNYTLATKHNAFVLADEVKRTFRKELIYADAFYHPVKGEDFRVGMLQLENWVTQFNAMQKNGVKVTLPVHHTDDPEANRGFVVGMEIVGKALFADVQFAKPEYEFLASVSDVSIFAAKTFTDGKGNVYPNPILHVALTTSPVIPGLSSFEAISASLTQPKEKEHKMSLKELLEKAGLSADEGKEEEFILAALGELTKLREEIKAAADEDEEEELSTDEEDEAEKEKEKMLSLVSPALVGVLRKNREHELKELICSGRISPKVGKDLTAKYCGEKGLALSLVSGDAKTDDFDEIVKILKQNEVTPLGEKSGHQAISLSSDDNCMIKAAKARA